MLRYIAIVAFACIAVPAAAAPCAGFTDVEDTNPFCANVAWIKNRNITLGCSSATQYCPNDVATRLAMAAFLNRLGDVVLPPNVIWVAPTGGMFQSIQAAIDYAATLPAEPPRLVKVAPGTYTEAVVMSPGVDVEGSGRDRTVISSAVCSSSQPTTGTVKGASNSQLRDATVQIAGSTSGNNCAAVYLDNVNGTALRNVRIELGSVGGGHVYGVMLLKTTALAVVVTLDQVDIDLLDLGPTRTGILVDADNSWITLQDLRIGAVADLASATGLRVNGGTVALERVKLRLVGGIPPSSSSATALQMTGTSNVMVERSWLRAQGGVFADVGGGSATLRIATSMIEGSLSGSATCFANYSPSFMAASC